MLDIHKHNIKETWAVLRQVMNKNKHSVKLSNNFYCKWDWNVNSKRIAEEINTFFWDRYQNKQFYSENKPDCFLIIWKDIIQHIFSCSQLTNMK